VPIIKLVCLYVFQWSIGNYIYNNLPPNAFFTEVLLVAVITLTQNVVGIGWTRVDKICRGFVFDQILGKRRLCNCKQHQFPIDVPLSEVVLRQ